MESALTQAVGKLLAIAENYPQLRAVEGVQQLQEQSQPKTASLMRGSFTT
jgi:hypothetical protein